MNKENVTVVVLATGLTDRMNSKKSKLLMSICGKPMAAYAIEAAQAVSASKPVMVVDEDAGELQDLFADSVLYAEQNDALLPQVCLPGGGVTVVLSADMPLVDADMLNRLRQTSERKDVGACVAMNEDETAQSASVYCFDTAILRKAIDTGAGTLSECVKYFADNGHGVEPIYSNDCDVAVDRIQLAQISERLRTRINNNLMRAGVTLIDPQSTYIDAGVKIGTDTTVYPGVVIEGDCEIGQDVILYPGSRIVDSSIGDGSVVQNSVMMDAIVGENSTIGPYAYLRPNTVIGNGCRVGDFVEVKNAHIKDGAKVSHLTYVGDGEIGEKSNIGCGVVFVNYDGKKKSRTVVGRNAFVGCNVNLIAPVEVGDGAFVAAGTTVTHDVSKDALAIGRSKQKDIEGWAKKWWDK
ncbi:MAG: NTP transferase domain-containing protein [Clostridia bacterium]|jgi:bifunctional UDP-N-acetylglucosamine pyrophosphorylase / glucosamine-1-phosphate N-acetyltransferase|nr:NTP transferase domain-containing protein [Clostridia bacterium]MBT7122647.1 NTP transferase domain-containing protein [Clostridia bacterium]